VSDPGGQSWPSYDIRAVGRSEGLGPNRQDHARGSSWQNGHTADTPSAPTSSPQSSGARSPGPPWRRQNHQDIRSKADPFDPPSGCLERARIGRSGVGLGRVVSDLLECEGREFRGEFA
jgi:hypothetical protein